MIINYNISSYFDIDVELFIGIFNLWFIKSTNDNVNLYIFTMNFELFYDDFDLTITLMIFNAYYFKFLPLLL